MRIQSIADLGATIRGRRLDLGWSQARLAEEAGVSRKWVSEAELGITVAGLGTVLRVLDVLGLELEATLVPVDEGEVGRG